MTKKIKPVALLRDVVRPELRWAHYRLLLRVEGDNARNYYLTEAANQNWSTRTLERQINSLYYERLLMSRDKSPVVDEMQEKTAPLAATPRDFIKDPYVLEFQNHFHATPRRRNERRIQTPKGCIL